MRLRLGKRAADFPHSLLNMYIFLLTVKKSPHYTFLFLSKSGWSKTNVSQNLCKPKGCRDFSDTNSLSDGLHIEFIPNAADTADIMGDIRLDFQSLFDTAHPIEDGFYKGKNVCGHINNLISIPIQCDHQQPSRRKNTPFHCSTSIFPLFVSTLTVTVGCSPTVPLVVLPSIETFS